ncbi:MAG: surface-adhesin E family protein [Hyphomicrobium sp.]
MIYKKLFAVLALSVVADAAATVGTAAELHPIRTAEHATIYVELDTINRAEGKPVVWTLWDHRSEQVNLYHEPYRSVRLLNEYDCSARTVRLVEIIEYADSLGNGAALRHYPGTDTDARPVTPGSVADEILKDVCATPAANSQKSF